MTRVFDVGRLETGKPYIVMEYLDGEDLQNVLHARGVLPIAEACAHMLQACEAMAEAHAAGIIHRDLKPANLFLTHRPDGRPLIKVLDFGISKLEEDLSLTTTQGSMGSPLYMSPEQLESAKHVTPKTDLWALGAILYELVTGHTAFSADSTAGLYARILTAPPVPPSQLRPDIPQEVERAILRCLDKTPALRFETVADTRLRARAVRAAVGPPERRRRRPHHPRVQPRARRASGEQRLDHAAGAQHRARGADGA